MAQSQVTLLIDHRENKLKTTLLEDETVSSFKIKCDNLSCGDFIIQVDDEPIIVIERKTISDLVSSIRDGRYRVQKARMCENYGVNKVLYVIEGNITIDDAPPQTINGFDKVSIVSAILNTIFRDNIKIIQVPDTNGTFNLIKQLLLRIGKNPTKYTCNSEQNKVITVAKEDLIHKHKVSTKSDMFFYQLTQVPGISAKTASAFVQVYGDMKRFYEQMMPLEDLEKLKLLKNITIQDSNSKPRKINAKVAESIIKFMF